MTVLIFAYTADQKTSQTQNPKYALLQRVRFLRVMLVLLS